MKKSALKKKIKEQSKLVISKDKVQNIRNVLKGRTCALTCTGRIDGIGAQCWATISTIIAAKFLGFEFIHTPFKNVDHNDLNIVSKRWNHSWENILKINSLSYNTNKKENWRKKLLDWGSFLRLTNKSYDHTLTKNTCFIVKHSHDFINIFHDDPEMKAIINEVKMNLQLAFHSNECPVLNIKEKSSADQIQNIHPINGTKKGCDWFDDSRIDIAIHIRKGDVIEWNITTRITENSYFINLAKQLDEILKQKHKYRFHIFSEGTIGKDFPELTRVKGKELIEYMSKHQGTDENIKEKTDSIVAVLKQESNATRSNTRSDTGSTTTNTTAEGKLENNIYFHMHLNGDARQAFLHLCHADILVTCKSCFSYVAAFYNASPVILFSKFWFPPLSDRWITLNDDGTL